MRNESELDVRVTLLFGASPQGPCHTQLHAALDTITASQQAFGERFTSFYLPNCDKHGYYKAKQVSFTGPPGWSLGLGEDMANMLYLDAGLQQDTVHHHAHTV